MEDFLWRRYALRILKDPAKLKVRNKSGTFFNRHIKKKNALSCQFNTFKREWSGR